MGDENCYDQMRGLLGWRIRKLREQRQLSQNQLASLCGVHRTYLSQVECGQRNVSIDSLFSIASALDVSLSELFQGVSLPEGRRASGVAYWFGRL